MPASGDLREGMEPQRVALQGWGRQSVQPGALLAPLAEVRLWGWSLAAFPLQTAVLQLLCGGNTLFLCLLLSFWFRGVYLAL